MASGHVVQVVLQGVWFNGGTEHGRADKARFSSGVKHIPVGQIFLFAGKVHSSRGYHDTLLVMTLIMLSSIVPVVGDNIAMSRPSSGALIWHIPHRCSADVHCSHGTLSPVGDPNSHGSADAIRGILYTHCCTLGVCEDLTANWEMISSFCLNVRP